MRHVFRSLSVTHLRKCGGMDREDRKDGPVHSRTEPGHAEEALHQCQLLQNLVDISISSLRALRTSRTNRTSCSASNDLTQHEIRTLEVNMLLVLLVCCSSLQQVVQLW